MLISSLPPVHQDKLLKRMIENRYVDAVRYNTGMSSAYEPQETVQRIQSIAKPLGKPVYIDLKAKQLRIIEWANLPEGPIILNHPINVGSPARVYFRGDNDRCRLCKVVDGTKIYVDPLPKNPVGRGQSVNIVAKKMSIERGLLDLDREYIEVAIAEGITRFNLSFTESWDDVQELEEVIVHTRGSKPLREYEIDLKIESRAGVEFVTSAGKKLFRSNHYRLMAARDDLMIQVGGCEMPDALKKIIKADPNAICASRLLLGLETGGVSLADISDLEYMRLLGYKHFMLSDGISRNHFQSALAFWKKYWS
jgi:pyruvate kinase